MVEIKQRFNDVALSLFIRYLQEPSPKATRRYYCRFNFVAPGNEIPEWYNHQSVGSSISIELHPGWYSNKWMGFALCAVFRLKPLPPLLRMAIGCSLSLNGQKLSPSSIQRFGGKWGQPVLDHIWLFYVHRDIYFNNKWQDIYSQLEFSFVSRYLKAGIEQVLQVNKCGVRMIYEEDMEELQQTLLKQQSNAHISNTKRGLQLSYDIWCNSGRRGTSSKKLQLSVGPSGSACIELLMTTNINL